MYQQVSAPSHTQDMTAIHHPYDERLDAVRDRIAQLTLETKDLVSPEKVYQLKRREVIDVFERDYALNTEKYDDSDEGLRNRAEVFHQHHQKLRLLEHNHTRSAKADTLAFEEKVDRELKTFVKDVWELVWSASGPPNTSSFTPRFKRDSVGIAAETSTNSTPQQSLSPAVDGYSTDLTTTDCEGEGDDDRKTSFIVKLPLPEKLKYGDAAKLSSKTPATRGPRSSSRASVKAPPPPEPERWIDFEDVYQRGQAKTKYRIVSDKRYPGKWYIFRCEEHNRNFMHRPQTAAGKHMTGKDHRCTISGAYFFELGVQVRNCNAALAKLNNDTIPEISELDQKAPRGKGSPIRRRKASSMSTGYEPDTDCDDETSDERLCKYPRHTDRRRMRALGDVNPVPGQVFNVYWPKVKKWYAAVILPKGPFSEIGLSGSMEDTPLLDSLPSCYERDGTSWKCKEGYNDGEPHASEQMYPAMYFDGPHPNVCDYAWLSIKDLEPFDRCTIEVMYRDIAIQHIKGREKQKEDELYDSDAESSEYPSSNSPSRMSIDLTAEMGRAAIKYEHPQQRNPKTCSDDEDVAMDTSTSLESATDSDGDDEMTTYSEAKVTLHRVMPFELNSKPVNGEESSSHSKQNVSQGHGESQGLGELIVVKQPSNASVVRKSDDHQRETAPSVLPLEKVKKSDSPRVAKRTPGPKRAEKWSSKSFRKPA